MAYMEQQLKNCSGCYGGFGSDADRFARSKTVTSRNSSSPPCCILVLYTVMLF